jgi:hypothetical protein
VAYGVLARAFPSATNRATRLERVRQALNHAACTHVTATNVCVDGRRWGHGWQSSFLCGHVGLACLLAETELPPATVRAVQRVVADEANYVTRSTPLSGYVNDTKAE